MSNDLEVQTQATSNGATFIHEDRAADALAALSEFSAHDLGAGWDMTVEELRALAYLETEDYDRAKSTIRNIQSAWPNDEQVQIPSALVLIQVYQREGLSEEAHSQAESALSKVTDPVYKDMLEEIVSTLR